MAKQESQAGWPMMDMAAAWQPLMSGNLLPENISLRSALTAQAEIMRRLAGWHERAAECLERAAKAESELTGEMGQVAGLSNVGGRWFQLWSELYQLGFEESGALLRAGLETAKTESTRPRAGAKSAA